MEKRSVFTFKSYKALMSHRLLGESNRGQLSRAAEFLNCQRSYLSRVIKGEQHLTPDQAHRLTRFWKFTNDERDFFSTLVEHDRAGHPEYRAFLNQKIIDLRKRHESIQERTQRQSHVTENIQLQYFSSWIPAALQFLTMIPRYQKITALSERLGLKPEMLMPFLEQLEASGMIERQKDKWINKQSNLHVPKQSPLVQLHHQNWRNRALLDAPNMQSDHVHFTAVYTLSMDDYQRIKDMLLDFITDANRIIGPSECEECVAVTLDLFRV